MRALRTVSEVLPKLASAEFAKPHIVTVNKSFGPVPYIEWHEVIRMLDEVFGPFGHSEKIVGSQNFPLEGIYLVDLELTVRALDDETGEVLEVSRAGRGVGYVAAANKLDQSDVERQSHGAKSDAISNASKALGDGFALFTYPSKKNGNGASNGNGGSYPKSNGNGGSNGGDGLGARPSVKQTPWLTKNGYSEAEVAKMPFAQWKGALDAIFAAKNAGETFNRAAYEASLAGDSTNVDDLPF